MSQPMSAAREEADETEATEPRRRRSTPASADSGRLTDMRRAPGRGERLPANGSSSGGGGDSGGGGGWRGEPSSAVVSARLYARADRKLKTLEGMLSLLGSSEDP